MADKMDPEEEFLLLYPRKVNPNILIPDEAIEEGDPEDPLDAPPKETPKWIRYAIISIITIIAIGSFCFVGIIARESYLLYANKDVTPQKPAVEKPRGKYTTTYTKAYTEAEIEGLVTARLRAFLDSTNPQQRLQHVLTPNIEQTPMFDYYEKRGNLDKALWKIELIKLANLDGNLVWMVAYQDVTKALKYIRFERSGNEFLIQWSSSYGYGELSWNDLARVQPSQPVQMRCFVLRHSGSLPPGINPKLYLGLTIENMRGEFTSTSIMRRESEGAQLLAKLPAGARTPVNLLLKYTDLPNGTRQLTVDRLLHFQWYQATMANKGRPVQLR